MKDPVALSSSLPASRALSEAARLLHKMRLSANQPAYREGRQAAVLADPFWDKHTGKVRILVSCQALGDKVDWQALPIWLRSQTPLAPIQVAHLDRRGAASFEDLSPDEYMFSTYRSYRVARGKLTISQQAYSHPALLAALGSTSAAHIEEYTSADGTVLAQVETNADGVVLAFKAPPTTVNQSVCFVFVSAEGKGDSVETVQLKPGVDGAVARAVIGQVPPGYTLAFWIDAPDGTDGWR